MPRVPQPRGERGSLKWIQQAVEESWPSLNQPIIDGLGGNKAVEWLSPRADDDFAEYCDGSFLDILGLGHLRGALKKFWPARGPQWDALGLSSSGIRLLVEAKAHVAEMCSPASAASQQSLALIRERLNETAKAMGARPVRAEWHQLFYQLANRFAHLHWLLQQGVDARLVLVNFIGDRDMGGPDSAAEWEAAYQVALYAMGLGKRHQLSKHVIEVFPSCPL